MDITTQKLSNYYKNTKEHALIMREARQYEDQNERALRLIQKWNFCDFDKNNTFFLPVREN